MKFLTDAQTPQPFVAMLRQLGWDVVTAREAGVEREKDDYKILARARSDGRVMISFDKLRRAAGVEVSQEIFDNGGKIIVLSGGPQQPLERALGRLLYFQPDWLPFLEQHDGMVRLLEPALPPRMTVRGNLRADLRLTGQQPFVGYLKKKEQERSAPRRSSRRTAPADENPRLPGFGDSGQAG